MRQTLSSIWLLCCGCMSFLDAPTTCESICQAPLICLEGKCHWPGPSDGVDGDGGTVDAAAVDSGTVIDAGTPADAGPCDAGPVVIDPTCGNAQLEPGEDCDDGNSEDLDACLSSCRFPLSASGGHNQSCWRIGAQIVCAGNNAHGQLGNGSTEAAAGFVPVAGEFVEVVSMAAANCAIQPSGQVQCWGACTHGALGSGSVEGCTAATSPTAVTGLSDAVQLAGGDWFACALRSDRTVSCWGHNDLGSLGGGDRLTRSQASAVLGLEQSLQIAAGGYHACALDTAGVVRCWGAGERGQLGNGSIDDRSEPVEVPLPRIARIAAGGYHTCALDTQGGLWCWGHNSAGQLGVDSESDVQTLPLAVDLEGRVVDQLFAGNAFTCLLHDGAVSCSGDNTEGQLGLGDTTPRTRFATIPNFSPIWLGANSRSQTAFAVVSPGSFFVWGKSNLGQLGLAPGEAQTSPVCVRVTPEQVCP